MSLEDLSGIATITSELVRAGVLMGSQLPWTVSVHGLRVITELVERPAEMLLYLRRRTEPDVTRRFHAIDELDFFLEFYRTGLYVEPDPERVAAELPQLGEPTVAARRRFRNQGLQILTSRTDQLDAWYFNQLGIRHSPAPKPQLNANSRLLTLIDEIARLAHPGWLRLGATLLDADEPTQARFAEYANQVLEVSESDRERHTYCVVGGSRADSSFVLIWASMAPGTSQSRAVEHIDMYVAAKKHQVQAAFGAGLLFDRGSDTRPVHVVYDASRPGADESLDRAVDDLGLQPLSRRKDRIPRAKAKRKGGASKTGR